MNIAGNQRGCGRKQQHYQSTRHNILVMEEAVDLCEYCRHKPIFVLSLSEKSKIEAMGKAVNQTCYSEQCVSLFMFVF